MQSSLLRTMVVAGMLMLVQGCAVHHADREPVHRSAHRQIQSGSSFQKMISDRLYFGRSIPGGGTVSDEEWNNFLSEVVTPRFPSGLSVWKARGQWRGIDSVIQSEESTILDLLHPDDAASERSVLEIMSAYKSRFRQEAVLRVRDEVEVQFHE